MNGEYEVQDSLFHENVSRLTRLLVWPSVPLPVGGGRRMGKVVEYPVVEQPETTGPVSTGESPV